MLWFCTIGVPRFDKVLNSRPARDFFRGGGLGGKNDPRPSIVNSKSEV